MDEKTVARFWAKVDRSAGPDGCWLWTASKYRHGYGQFNLTGNGPRRAHRVAWEMANGQIPDGFGVCHRCDIPSCVNPKHLFLGTQKDNSRDMVSKGRHVAGVVRGSLHASARLTEEDVLSARAKVRDGADTIESLAKAFGVHQTTMWAAVRGKTWAHLGQYGRDTKEADNAS